MQNKHQNKNTALAQTHDPASSPVAASTVSCVRGFFAGEGGKMNTYDYPASGGYAETVATLPDGRKIKVDGQYGMTT